jgi:hypothetical protein
MSDILRFERKNESDLQAENPILDDGQLQFSIAENASKLKIGDGKHPYNDLPYTLIKNLGVKCSDNNPNIYPDVRTDTDTPRFKYKSDISDPQTVGNYLLRLSDIDVEYSLDCVEISGNFNKSELIYSSLELNSQEVDGNHIVKLVVPLELYRYNKISYCKISSIHISQSNISINSTSDVTSTFKICKYEGLYTDSTIDYNHPLAEICPASEFIGYDIQLNNPILYEDCYSYLMELSYTSNAAFHISIDGWLADEDYGKLYQICSITDNSIQKLNVQIPIKYECQKHIYNSPNVINFRDSYLKIVDNQMHNYYLRYFDGSNYVDTCTYIKSKNDVYIYGDICRFPVMSRFVESNVSLGTIQNNIFTNCTTISIQDKLNQFNVHVSPGSSKNICQTLHFNVDGRCGYAENSVNIFHNIEHIVKDISFVQFPKDSDYAIAILDDSDEVDVSEPLYIAIYSDAELPIEYVHYDMDRNIHIKSSASFYQDVHIVLFTSLGEPFYTYNTYLVATEY